MQTNVKDLPPMLRALVADAGLRVRKILVLNVGPRQGISDGAISDTTADVDGFTNVEMVPFHEGGGYRTSAAAYVVHAWGGKPYLAVVRPSADFGYSWKPETLAVACDLWAARGGKAA